jgi:hypothetical protein
LAGDGRVVKSGPEWPWSLGRVILGFGSVENVVGEDDHVLYGALAVEKEARGHTASAFHTGTWGRYQSNGGPWIVQEHEHRVSVTGVVNVENNNTCKLLVQVDVGEWLGRRAREEGGNTQTRGSCKRSDRELAEVLRDVVVGLGATESDHNVLLENEV